ncbi:serine/threonine-protein kinase pim-1-like [Neopelma chrysocephalum]|uniref:serine/threonine-protein kinase pim-1-like n=1 Tax=Neopelma chrysocephalum TaxID=114329 RepID=UPI000FCD15CD|nr:serine/threonine-protein kinase pim-1-like [Neopelma chrysocephalum]
MGTPLFAAGGSSLAPSRRCSQLALLQLHQSHGLGTSNSRTLTAVPLGILYWNGIIGPRQHPWTDPRRQCSWRSCPSITQLLNWLELPDSFLLVTEHLEPAQDQFDLLVEWEFLCKKTACWLFCQVLEAVWHCAHCGVLHRDIKPENIILHPDTSDLKLNDFSFATFLWDEPYTCFAGTQQYCPPEWIHFGLYRGHLATIWSLGVLLCVMVCGNFPFEEDEDIMAGQLCSWQQVSSGWSQALGDSPVHTSRALTQIRRSFVSHWWLQEVALDGVDLAPVAEGAGACSVIPLCSTAQSRPGGLCSAEHTWRGMAWHKGHRSLLQLTAAFWFLSPECQHLI